MIPFTFEVQQLYSFIYFESGYPYEAQAVLSSSCLSLMSAGITSIHHHIQLYNFSFVFCDKYKLYIIKMYDLIESTVK
jgi:hypothetical protein